MDIQTIQPRTELKPYIDFYYFIRNDTEDFHSCHYSFPHTVNVISIYKQASFESSLGRALIYHDSSNDYLTLLQGKCQIPLQVELNGTTNRISIFFKPLGLNQFIEGHLSDYMTKTTNAFYYWSQDPAYLVSLDKSFATNDLQKKIDALELFLLTKLRPADISYIAKATHLLIDIELDYSIEEILEEIDIPIRTFNRKFKEVIGVSPIEYQRIARFRHSLNNKLFHAQFKKLTEIGYNSHFYDQSYFIKIYKKLTGSNPKAFFNTIEKLGDDKLIFQFIKA